MSRLFFLALLSIGMSQNYTYNLEDINSNSIYFGDAISPSFFSNEITIHYFGKQNWGLCTTRVGNLEDIYQELLAAGIYNVKFITIGKSSFHIGVGNWGNSSFPILVDPSPANSVWLDWGADIRDLYFLNPDGTLFDSYNISETSAVDQIQSTINGMLASLNIENLLNESFDTHVYPNPFNPLINIAFSMDYGSYSNITVLDIKGAHVETISNTYYNPGNYVLQWDASNYSSGIYVINFHIGVEKYNKKIILSK